MFASAIHGLSNIKSVTVGLIHLIMLRSVAVCRNYKQLFIWAP